LQRAPLKSSPRSGCIREKARAGCTSTGIVTLILAFMIWNAWPSSSVWAMGTLVGVGMLCSGVTRLMLSMATRTAMPA
jgi:uncharacterized membrane protein HdeD (DUF308 family)